MASSARSGEAPIHSVQTSKSPCHPRESGASDVEGSSYTDTSVTNGTTYYYTVTASNSAGTSELSPEDSATPVRPLVNVATGGTAYDGEFISPDNAGSAFDRNSATEWFHSGVSGLLMYDLGRTETVQRYTVVSSFDRIERDAKDWEFQGSNDNDTWTTLDLQSGQLFAERYELKSYAVANPAPYRYYRLNITANNGDGSFIALGELGLFASDTE